LLEKTKSEENDNIISQEMQSDFNEVYNGMYTFLYQYCPKFWIDIYISIHVYYFSFF